MNDTKTLTFKDGDISLDVIIKDNTGWLSAKQIATLYGVTQRTINRHLNATYKSTMVDTKDNETLRDKNVSIAVHSFANAIGKRPVQFYDLDVIIELGIGFGSNRGNILKEFVNKELY